MIRYLFLALLLGAPADAAQTFAFKGTPERFSVTTALTELTLPNGTDYLRIRPADVDAYLEIDCTDGGALGTDYETIGQSTVEYRMVAAGHTVCIAGSGSGTVEVTPFDQGR